MSDPLQPAPSPAPPTASAASPKSERLLSLDALRGFDMFWIVGGRELAVAVSRWSNIGVDGVRHQFEHVAWEGFTFYDLIFPLFLFLVGAAIPFSIGSARQRQTPVATIHWRIARRTALLFLLGLVYNRDLDLNPETFRLAGVLQRIALTYCAAALLVMHTGLRTQAAVLVGLLLGYWALIGLVPAPGSGFGDYTPAGALPGWVDRQFLPGKHVVYGFGDNEGILSTLPAIATALLGAFAGHWLRSPRAPWTKAVGLAAAGLVCLALGGLWHAWFPIIKNIWTSSYVLFAGGWSLLLLAAFYTLIDVLGYRRWSFFFVVIGVNAITIYLARRLIDFNSTNTFLFAGAARLLGSFGPVLLAAGVVALEWALLWVLYRAKIFLRV